MAKPILPTTKPMTTLNHLERKRIEKTDDVVPAKSSIMARNFSPGGSGTKPLLMGGGKFQHKNP